MIVTGIVVEYNPFHNGHIHHINEARRLTNCDVLIAVMSGNFVQRGEPAIIDKWQRAKEALKHDVDLIIEIPFPFVNQNASVFTETAVHLLNLAQCDYIVFGSETNNLEELQDFASLNIKVDHLKETMDSGISYPKAYGLLSKEFYPNDILAIGYLRALEKTNIKPISIQRTNQYHDLKMTNEIASATAIRNALVEKKDVSNFTPMIFEQKLAEMERYYPLIRVMLLTHDRDHLQSMALFAEGIENHLIKQAEKYVSYKDFISQTVSRRYTRSRIQRTLVAMMTQLTQKQLDNLKKPNFLKILGFNELGQKHLRYLIDQGIYVVTKFNRIPYEYAQLELKSTAVYSYWMNKNRQDYLYNREFNGPIVKKGDRFVRE